MSEESDVGMGEGVGIGVDVGIGIGDGIGVGVSKSLSGAALNIVFINKITVPSSPTTAVRNPIFLACSFINSDTILSLSLLVQLL